MPGDDTTARFATNTHHHADFAASALATLKRETSTTVSTIIPARNEEATVAQVVSTLRTRLVDRDGLVDEIVVVDADSSDSTAELARNAGARVVSQSQVLPEAGPGAGKGEALWKGLAASHGDLVVFVDADIVDISARFVTGLVGPLLTDPDISFTKACYDRPLRTSETLEATGGGRVTELLARPVIATFWPELSWLAQPLSGEYAGRRELLESLPFVCGWGVELALLVDILEREGAQAIAQVDLGRRVHDHQTLDALGRMSAEILQVALSRAGVRGPHGRPLTAPVLRQPVRTAQGGLRLVDHRPQVDERPPLSEWYGTGDDARRATVGSALR